MWEDLKELKESDLIFIEDKRKTFIKLIEVIQTVNNINARIQPTEICGIGRKTNNPIGTHLFRALQTLSIYNQDLLMGHLLPFFDYFKEKVENELKQITLMGSSQSSPLEEKT